MAPGGEVPNQETVGSKEKPKKCVAEIDLEDGVKFSWKVDESKGNKPSKHDRKYVQRADLLLIAMASRLSTFLRPLFLGTASSASSGIMILKTISCL